MVMRLTSKTSEGSLVVSKLCCFFSCPCSGGTHLIKSNLDQTLI